MTSVLDLDAVEARYRFGSGDWNADHEALIAEVKRLRESVANVERLCRSYTPEPPPIFRGPGLSEFGHGNNHGMKTMAEAVLGTLRGEVSDDDACCTECKTGGEVA